MTQDNTSKRIDDLLEEYQANMFKYYNSGAWKDAIGYPMEWDEQAKSLIMDLILERESALLSRIKDEVIGEDQEKKVEDWECPCGTNHHLETSYHNRNELRSEQRTKLDQLSKENKNG